MDTTSLVNSLNGLNPKVTITIDTPSIVNLGIMLGLVIGGALAVWAILK